MYLAKVYVTLKPTVNDPQGLTIKGALYNLGFDMVKSVRYGKYLEIQIEAQDASKADEMVKEMCRKLLANTVIENYNFVGLKNWQRLFSDARFHSDLRNHIFYAAGFMTQCIVFGFVLAALLDQHIKGEAVFRTVFIFPFAVSGVVTGVAWRWLMQPTTGINLIFASIGLENFQPTWFVHPQYGMFAVSIAAAWQFSGYVMALYLAGLRGIPMEMREAAAIDGAGTFAIYRYVIIPLLMPVTFVVIVLTGMNSIRVFDLVATMGGSGPAFATDTLAFNMYQTTFSSYRFSLGAAIGAFMIFLAAFLVIPYLRSMRGEVER